MKVIQVKEPGGPEKMELVEVPKPQPGPGQALVRIAAIGVNFIDVYFRMGRYKADLPTTLGGRLAFGEVPEWSNGTVSKTVVRVTVPWVRIPPSPPAIKLLI